MIKLLILGILTISVLSKGTMPSQWTGSIDLDPLTLSYVIP